MSLRENFFFSADACLDGSLPPNSSDMSRVRVSSSCIFLVLAVVGRLPPRLAARASSNRISDLACSGLGVWGFGGLGVWGFRV
jgi:hypothetical protein